MLDFGRFLHDLMDPMRILLLFSIILLTNYFWNVCKKPKLVCKSEIFQTFLLDRCPLLKEKYWPTIWCYQAHFMTYFSNFFRQLLVPETAYKREFLTTPDGGRISLDWFKNENDSTDDPLKPIALFYPGLTGSSKSEYVRPMVQISAKIGYRSVVLNHRGTDDTPLLTARMYCAASDDDLRTCLDHIKNKYPEAKIMATGFSLGGIILTRYLITSGTNSKIDAAFLVSVCWDFISTSVNLERMVNYPLNKYLCHLMIALVNANSHLFETLANIDLKQVRKSKSLREFDESFTRRMFDFKSVENYYEEASYRNRLQHIKTYTLCLNSSDDMFALEDTLPVDIIEKQSEHVAMVVTSHGGHIGFMDGILPFVSGENGQTNGPNYYMERLARQYFQSMLDCEFQPL